MNWLTGLFGWKRIRHIPFVPAHPLVAPTWPSQPKCVVAQVETVWGVPVAVRYVTFFLN